ncbi:MAG: branched-chain amino acid ABC transporter permease [Ktedonobacteraceae bacterium]
MKNTRLLAALASLGIFAVFPLLFSNPAITTVAVFALIFAGAAMGWNIFCGYTGYISLGHAAFYGIGAYILALMCQIWNIPGGIIPFLLLPVVGLLTGVCSLLLGWIALKTRRFTFLVITIAIFSVAAQLPNFLTGFIPGISLLTLPIPAWGGSTYNVPFYYIAFLLLILAFGVSWWIRHSRYGLNLLAIRDDEARAEGLGLKVGPLKLSAFMISASFVGMAGAMSVYFIGFISPTSAFDRSLNIAIPLMVFLGGSGTVWGPIIGAMIVVVLQQYLTLQFGTSDWDLILYGVMFLAIILALPEGILPSLVRRLATRKGAWSTANIEAAETWSQANIEEAMPAISMSLPITPAWSIASPLLQEIIADDIVQIQPSGPLPVLIPRRHVKLPAHKGLTQKVRAQRLVSLSPGTPGKASALSEPVTPLPLPLVGWPCPRCNEPLLAWGDMHFCKRCGLKLPRPQGQTTISKGDVPVYRPPR